jgi:hypothetical protein
MIRELTRRLTRGKIHHPTSRGKLLVTRRTCNHMYNESFPCSAHAGRAPPPQHRVTVAPSPLSRQRRRSFDHHYGDDNIVETFSAAFVSVQLASSQVASDNLTETGQATTAARRKLDPARSM